MSKLIESLRTTKGIILIILFFISTSSYSQKIKENEVPENILEKLKAEYPNAKVKQWELIDSQYIANIKDDGAKAKVYLNESAEWIETRFESPENELPSNISDYISKEYKNYEITKSEMLQKPKQKSQYIIELSKPGINSGEPSIVIFDNYGKFLSRTDPLVKKNDKNKQSKNNDVADKDNNKDKVNNKKEIKEPKKNIKEKENKKNDNKRRKEPLEKYQIKNDKIPQAVEKAFLKKYQRIEEIKWFNISDDSTYWAKFIYKEQNCEAYFTKSGIWKEHIIDLNKETLLPAITKYLDKAFSKYKFSSAKKIQKSDKNDSFTVKIIEKRNYKNKAETTIFFDKLGKLIRTIDAEYVVENKDEEDIEDKKLDKQFEKDQDNLKDGTENMIGKEIEPEELLTKISEYILQNYSPQKIKKAIYKENEELGQIYELSVAYEGLGQAETIVIFDKEGKFIKSTAEQVVKPKRVIKKEPTADAFLPNDSIVAIFKKQYPKATNVFWEETDERTYISTFTDKNIQQKAHYDKNGIWQKTQFEIDTDKLSVTIQKFIEKNYGGFVVDKAFSIKKNDKKVYTAVNIKNKKLKTEEFLEFNAGGKLVE